MPNAEIKLYKSNRETIKLILYAALPGIAGIVMLKGSMVSVLLCSLMILLAGIGILKGLISLLDQRPYLTISEAGIMGSATYHSLICWTQVRNVRLHQDSDREAVLLLEIERQTLSLKFKFWSSSRGSKKRSYELKLSLGQLNMDAQQLAGLIQAVVACPPEERSEAVLRALPAYQQQQVALAVLQQTT